MLIQGSLLLWRQLHKTAMCLQNLQCKSQASSQCRSGCPISKCTQTGTFAEFMKRGLFSELRIGFNPAHPLRTAPANFRSLQDLQPQSTNTLHKRWHPGGWWRITSPVSAETPSEFSISKHHQPGKFRLIVDLSAQGFTGQR